MVLPGGVEGRVGGPTRAEGAGMTPGVVTEWYRAPEVFIRPRTATVNTWIFGCIFLRVVGQPADGPMPWCGGGVLMLAECGWLAPFWRRQPALLAGGACAGPPHRGLGHSSLPTTFALPWGMALGAACPPVGLQVAAINGGSSNRHICLWLRANQCPAACGPRSCSDRIRTCSSHLWRWPVRGQGRITCF